MNKKPLDVNSGGHVTVQLTSVEAPTEIETFKASIWLSANFASFWYSDAELEAIETGDIQRRRREITFSVAAVESYLLEWVRDEVLKRNFLRLDTYFPPDERRSASEKWKNVTKALASDGLILSAPSFGGKTWQDFCTLVEFRNGLIHARASRPQTTDLSGNQMPVPSTEDLKALKPGWALGVITALIQELHMATETKKPEWLRSNI